MNGLHLPAEWSLKNMYLPRSAVFIILANDYVDIYVILNRYTDGTTC